MERALPVAAALLTCFVLACRTAPGPARPQEVVAQERANPLDETMWWWSAYREGDGITIAVNVAAALRRPDPAFVPLLVAVANQKLPDLTITPESVTLIDDTGTLYPLATAHEVVAIRTQVAADRRVFNPSLMRTVQRQFKTYILANGGGRLQERFAEKDATPGPEERSQQSLDSPPRSAPAAAVPGHDAASVRAEDPDARDAKTRGLTLSRGTWTYDLLYFVRPPGELKGRDLRVRLKTREMSAPLVFPIRIS